MELNDASVLLCVSRERLIGNQTFRNNCLKRNDSFSLWPSSGRVDLYQGGATHTSTRVVSDLSEGIPRRTYLRIRPTILIRSSPRFVFIRNDTEEKPAFHRRAGFLFPVVHAPVLWVWKQKWKQIRAIIKPNFACVGRFCETDRVEGDRHRTAD